MHEGIHKIHISRVYLCTNTCAQKVENKYYQDKMLPFWSVIRSMIHHSPLHKLASMWFWNIYIWKTHQFSSFREVIFSQGSSNAALVFRFRSWTLLLRVLVFDVGPGAGRVTGGRTGITDRNLGYSVGWNHTVVLHRYFFQPFLCLLQIHTEFLG